MQVRYQSAEDRLLWQLRTQGGELFALWLTRRLLQQLMPPLNALVTQTAVARVAPQANVMHEAREMMAQVARARPLPGTDFSTPFNPQAVAQPRGPQPLLPTEVDLGPRADGRGLRFAAREPGGRSLNLQLSADLATALMRLIDQALAEADWGLSAAAASHSARADAQDAGDPPVLPAKPGLLN